MPRKLLGLLTIGVLALTGCGSSSPPPPAQVEYQDTKELLDITGVDYVLNGETLAITCRPADPELPTQTSTTQFKPSLATSLGKELDGKKLIITNTIDPTGSRVIDARINGELAQISPRQNAIIANLTFAARDACDALLKAP